MVFVTVGNARSGFLRLLNAVDALAAKGVFRGVEPIIVQSGHTRDFQSRHCKVVPFLTIDEFGTMLAKADLIIAHGGSTVMTAVALDKVPVVMPRRRRYGEVVNDHQVAFVDALAAEGLIVPSYEAAELEDAIVEARSRTQAPRNGDGPDIAALIGKAIAELVESERKISHG